LSAFSEGRCAGESLALLTNVTHLCRRGSPGPPWTPTPHSFSYNMPCWGRTKPGASARWRALRTGILAGPSARTECRSPLEAYRASWATSCEESLG
jgi:hypothetical protein